MSEMNETNQRADAGPNTERESYGAHAIRRASEAAQKALAVIEEATLSFLGVGVPPTQPSLGTLIRDARPGELEVMEADEENESCIVMQDVEGNEFCLD
jgi:hypothetical protein